MSDSDAYRGIGHPRIWLSSVTESSTQGARRSGKESQMTERMNLPVLPLRDFVLFPGVAAPINAAAASARDGTPGRSSRRPGETAIAVSLFMGLIIGSDSFSP